MCAGEGESDWHVLTVTTGGDADFRQVRAASQIGGGVWVVAVALVGVVLGVMADAGDTAHGRVDESIDVVLDHGLFDSVGECRHLLVDNRLDFVALKLAGALHVRLVAFDSNRIDRSIRVSQGFALVYQLLNCLGPASSVVAHVGFIVGDEFGVTDRSHDAAP